MLMLVIKKIYKQRVSLAIFLALICSSNFSWAQTYYFQPGQSKTITLSEKVRTVFIAKESVANYEIIGENKLIIYAKQNGLTGLLAYDENNNIIIDDTIVVDPILSQVMFRLKKEFPNSNVTITKYAIGQTGDEFAYLVNGDVPDTDTKTRILNFVGALVGTDKKTRKIESSGGAINNDDIDFLEKNTYGNIIDKINVIQETQINVKLTFVEVSKEFTDALGIDWRSLTLESINGGGTAINDFGEFSLLGLKKGFDIHNIVTIIRAFNNDKLAKVLAEPNLSVLSGEAASFLVGGEIPVVTVGGKDNTSNVEYKEYGIKLNIGAKANSNKRIRLFIANEFSSISGTYSFNNYSIPTLRSRKTSSTIDVGDGESFVIAGLITEQDEETLSKIPFIGDIPILGALARSTAVNRGKTELVVFATVNIVTPKSSFEIVELPKFERTNTTNLFFNFKNNMEKQQQHTFPISNESEKFVNYMGFIE